MIPAALLARAIWDTEYVYGWFEEWKIMPYVRFVFLHWVAGFGPCNCEFCTFDELLLGATERIESTPNPPFPIYLELHHLLWRVNQRGHRMSVRLKNGKISVVDVEDKTRGHEPSVTRAITRDVAAGEKLGAGSVTRKELLRVMSRDPTQP